MRAIPDDLRELSTKQAHALRCTQLEAFGLRSREVGRRIDAGIWQRASARVIVTHSGEVSRLTWLWVASLHHERVGLTGAAALELDGLPAPHNQRIDLLTPRGQRQVPFAHCVITQVPAPVFSDGPGPLRTPIADSVAHAMGHAASPRQAVFHATWAVQRRLTTIEEIAAAIDGRPRSHAFVRARRILDLIEPGVHSIHEFDFARECRRRGLPKPVRQTSRRDSRGRQRFTDVEFHVKGRVVTVEIDGLQHLETQMVLDDQWRANELTLQGDVLLRVPALALRLDPDAFFDQLRRALAAAGAPLPTPTRPRAVH